MKHKGSIMTDTNTSRVGVMRAKCCGMVLHGGHPDPAKVVDALDELQARAEQAEARVAELDEAANRLRLTGPNSEGDYWLHVSVGDVQGGICLGGNFEDLSLKIIRVAVLAGETGE